MSKEFDEFIKTVGKMTEEEWQAAEKGLPFKQFSLYEHKETITSADTPTSSQTEISDEEIEKAAAHYEPMVTRRAWVSACKWYREQLKKK